LPFERAFVRACIWVCVCVGVGGGGGSLRVRTCLEKQLDDCDVVVDCCVVQGRVAVTSRAVHLGAVLDEKRGNLCVAVVAGLVKRCPSSIVLQQPRATTL
jgi:hypothetical protein